MIDLTNLKHVGWQRIVAELNAPAPDDRTFLERLLKVMVRAGSARQGVLLLPPLEGSDQSDPRVVSVFPEPGASTNDPEGRAARGGAAEGLVIEYAAEIRSAALAALETGQSRVFGLERGSSSAGIASGDLYDPSPSSPSGGAAVGGGAGGRGSVLAVPLLDVAGAPVAVVTMLVEPRARQALQSTLAMAEVLAGYVNAHAVKQQLRRVNAATFALDLGTRLLAGVNTAVGFKGACIQLVNEAARQIGVDRAALGWVRGDCVRVVAMSDTEQFDRRVAMVRALESAMDECLDQEQPVLHPAPPPDEDSLLAHAITQAHRELARGNTDLKVCSVPLRDGDKVIGVLTLEGTGAGTIDLRTIEILQATLDLVSPVMRVRHADDRHLGLRALEDLRRAGAWAVGPKHTWWKLAAIAATLALLVLTFWTTTYRVGAPATLTPRTRQVVSMPFDALLRSTPDGIEAGTAVNAGDVLAVLDTAELELSAEDARQKIAQAEKIQAAARAQGKADEAQRAQAQAQRARAELELAQNRIRQSTLVAPISGTITAGRLIDRVGSSLKLGDKLFEIAPLDELSAVVKVDERDIALIREGGSGQIATRSHPEAPFDFVVERIVPSADAAEGKNVFEVRCRVDKPAPWARPGMEGVAKLDTQRHSLLWIGTRRVLNAVRLWWW